MIYCNGGKTALTKFPSECHTACYQNKKPTNLEADSLHCVTSALTRTAQPRGRAWCCGAALGPLPAVAPGGRLPRSPFPVWALWGWGWLGWAMGWRGLPALTLSPLLPQPVWYQVRPLRQADLRQRLGAAGAGQRLPPRLLRLLLLQAAALHRRGVRLGGGEGAVPDPLRHHDREPQASGGKRYGAAVQPSARGHRRRGEVSGPVPLLLGACGEWDGACPEAAAALGCTWVRWAGAAGGRAVC